MPPIMHGDVIIIRLVFTAVLVAAGYILRPINGDRWISAGVGALVAICIILFELRIRRASLKTLIGAAVGSILGIVGAFLIGSLISEQETMAVSAKSQDVSDVVVNVLHGLCRADGRCCQRRLSSCPHWGILTDKTARRDLKILDTSVIIDGRIADVAETGFLTGSLIIPQFILRELQPPILPTHQKTTRTSGTRHAEPSAEQQLSRYPDS